MGLTVGSLCTGTGALDLAVEAVLDAQVLWCADPDPHARTVLDLRFPYVLNLGDLRTVSWAQVEPVDVVTAGFPCQDLSLAGRGAGLKEGTRSGLWFDIADTLRVLQPRAVLLENVAALRRRGLDRVLGDLAALRYNTAWMCLRASEVGAPHRRDRLFAWAVRDAAAADPDLLGPLRCRTQPHPHRRPQPGHHLPAPARPTPGHVPAAADADGQPRDDRRFPAAGQAQGWRARADAGRSGRASAADPAGRGRHQGQSQPARIERGLDAPLGGGPAPSPLLLDLRTDYCHPDSRASPQDWGPYAPAIARWEAVLGRAAPAPTEPGRTGSPRLSAFFVEWCLGLPPGHVSGVPGLPRTAQLRLLGNAVVPQQAAHALHELLARHAARPHPKGK